MFNLTLVSLSLLSLTLNSPLYAIHHSAGPRLTTIVNSHFQNFANHVLFSAASYHNTNIMHTTISHMLNGAIYLAQDNLCDGNKDTIIMHKEFSQKPTIGSCSNLAISDCTFSECRSPGNGGAILIQQEIAVTIHNTLFTKCETQNTFGAALCIVKNFVEKGTDFQDEMTSLLDIQYCCFDDCNYINNNGDTYGIVFSASKKTTLFYASTVKCAQRNAKGAQFDLQAEEVKSHYVNITNGKAKYCAGIEYRHAKTGFFRYQTITNLQACFAVAFTRISFATLEISDCNFAYNNIASVPLRNGWTYGGLVRVIHGGTVLQRFYFSHNTFDERSYYASYQYPDDTIFPTITLINCYADDNRQIVQKDSSNIFIIQNCTFNEANLQTTQIDQLLLGECKGAKTAEPLIKPTEEPTPEPTEEPTSEPTEVPPPLTEPDTDSDSKDKGGVSTAMIGGIVGAVAAVGIAIAAFFLIKKFKGPNINAAEAETLDDAGNAIDISNPLHDQNGVDDPFKEDFAGDN